VLPAFPVLLVSEKRKNSKQFLYLTGGVGADSSMVVLMPVPKESCLLSRVRCMARLSYISENGCGK
jgi:hypothetical protein